MEGVVSAEVKVEYMKLLGRPLTRVELTGHNCFIFYGHKILCIIYRIRNSGAKFKGLCYR